MGIACALCRKGRINMGFIDELLSSAKIVVDKAGKQTDKVLEISKLKYQSIQLQNELAHLYEQLGVAVYAKMVQEADNGDLIASLGDEITEVRAALEVVEEKISEQKNLRTCPNCGAKLPREAAFCSSCGTKLETAPDMDEPNCCYGEDASCCDADEACCCEDEPCCEKPEADEAEEKKDCCCSCEPESEKKAESEPEKDAE